MEHYVPEIPPELDGIITSITVIMVLAAILVVALGWWLVRRYRP